MDISGRIQTKFLDTVKFLETELQKKRKIFENICILCVLMARKGGEEFNIATGERRQ